MVIILKLTIYTCLSCYKVVVSEATTVTSYRGRCCNLLNVQEIDLIAYALLASRYLVLARAETLAQAISSRLCSPHLNHSGHTFLHLLIL